jgi:hypothetical protein
MISLRKTFLLAAIVCTTAAAFSKDIVFGRLVANGAGGKGVVNLPYRVPANDALGNQWFVYQGGWFRQQGNMPVYSEGGQLLINNSAPVSNTNQGRVEDNGELVLENLPLQGGSVTRRILFNKEEGYVRMIDILRTRATRRSVCRSCTAAR